MNYDGLRGWLDKVDALGELTTLENIDWNLEMGAIVVDSFLDPMIHPDSKVFLNSRAVIDGYRPYEWMNRFPEVAETSPALRIQVLAKLGRKFFGLR